MVQERPNFEKPKPNSGRVLKWEDIERKDGLLTSITLYGTAPATAANYEAFFTAPRPLEILWASESHRVLGTDAGAVTLNLEILDSGEALGAGDLVLSTAWNLKSTINTPVTKQGTDFTTTRVLKQGQRLALLDTGTLTAVAGLTVTIYFKSANRGDYF